MTQYETFSCKSLLVALLLILLFFSYWMHEKQFTSLRLFHYLVVAEMSEGKFSQRMSITTRIT